MPFCFERNTSRKFSASLASGTKATLEFVVIQADDEEMAFTAAVVEVPVAWRGLPREQWSFEPLGGGVWYVTVDYDPRVRSANNDAGKKSGEHNKKPPDSEHDDKQLSRDVSFTIGGGTKHITLAKEVIDARRIMPDGTVVNSPGCKVIGWSRTGIAGTDVISTASDIQVSQRLSSMTFGYFSTLYYAVATTNDNPFAGFDRGELLFAGAQGRFVDGDKLTAENPNQTEQQGYWNIGYRFMVSPNVRGDDAEVFPGVKFDIIRGWNLIDVSYQEAEVQASDDFDDTVLQQFPELVSLLMVYGESDFGDLEIEQSFFAV
jgi:hypothetical protein